MEHSNQINERTNSSKMIRRRPKNFESTSENPKPVKLPLKKVSNPIATVLMPTSSSTFKCEPAKRRIKRLNKSISRFGKKRERKCNMDPISLKVKPCIVKMTNPTNSSNNLKKMLADTSLREHIVSDTDLLKSFTSGFTDVSSTLVKNINLFPNKVQVGKPKLAKKQSNHEKTNINPTNLVTELKNLKVSEHSMMLCNYPDYFVICSSNGLNNEIAKVYRINNSKFLLSMKPGKRLCFVGIVDLELVSGCVEVLGYSANRPLEELLTVYSCQGSSHLFLKTSIDKSHTSEVMKENWMGKLVSIGLPMSTSQKILNEMENNVVFVLKRNSNKIRSTVWPMFLENHLSFSIFPHVDLLSRKSSQCHSIMERSIGCICQENLWESGYKEFNEVPEWSLIEHSILSKDVFKAVLCGGKSVGKSTLLRYLVNKCLQKWKSVLVVDCDLGQCEFTPPGCVSVTLVDQPLLGPNYSHLKEPLRCVHLGEVDVNKCPETYIKGYNWLIDYARQELGNIPWLINTMGFTKGFGVMVACDIIKIVNPSQVVQIQSKDRKLNFPQRLEPGYVYSQHTEAFSRRPQPLDFNLFVIPSGSESGPATKSRSACNRSGRSESAICA